MLGLLLTVLVLFLLLREQKSIQASDGTRFSSEEACRDYEAVLERVKTLYYEKEKKSSSTLTLGLRAEFLKLLKEEGFGEVKTLIKYRDDIKILAELLFVIKDTSV